MKFILAFIASVVGQTAWTDAATMTSDLTAAGKEDVKTIALTDANIQGDGPHTRSTSVIVDGQLAIGWSGIASTETLYVEVTGSTVDSAAVSACTIGASACLTEIGTLTTTNADDGTEEDKKIVY